MSYREHSGDDDEAYYFSGLERSKKLLKADSLADVLGQD